MPGLTKSLSWSELVMSSDDVNLVWESRELVRSLDSVRRLFDRGRYGKPAVTHAKYDAADTVYRTKRTRSVVRRDWRTLRRL